MRDIVWDGEDAFVGPVKVGSYSYDGIWGKGYNAHITLPQIKRFEKTFPTIDEAKLAIEKRVTSWFKVTE